MIVTLQTLDFILNLISLNLMIFYEVMVGSSNITASAFKTNIEWNVKTTLKKKDDEYLTNILNEFNNLWKKESFEVNEDF